jgi:hypothetical protein
MNIWIITTGSSDVQLNTKDNWNTLSAKVRSQLETKKQFSLSESDKNGQKRWLIPSRAMGVVYAQALTEHYKDLEFPLLNSFSGYLKSEKIELKRIIVLLTDQSNVVSTANKDKPSHPYWQDTCTLKPILQHHIKNLFPDVEMDSERDFPVLNPKSGVSGLDDWNEVLTLVQQQFMKLNIPEDATVYVSHQAGTPAISSAVQFESLTRFGQQVKFLVSNEQDSSLTRFIDRSSYLKKIRVQEALALLENFDYSGIYQLLEDDLQKSNLPIAQEILENLEIAMLWNSAKFKEFLERRLKLSSDGLEEWWRPAYEAAYLAMIRLKQGNTVEAFFHSFRAVEGLISKWAEQRFPDHIIPNDDSPLLKITILEVFDFYLGKKDQEKMLTEFKEKGTLVLSGFPLYSLLRADRPSWKKDCKDLSIFTEQIAPRRNKLFHRLKGLRSEEVWQEWKVDSLEKLEPRIISYLNFISGQSFTFLVESSLMPQLHQELKEALNTYQPE